MGEMQNELKPCPFCNATPRRNDEVCVCETKSCPIEGLICSVKAWNTRTPKPVNEGMDKLISPFVAGEQKKEILEALSHYIPKPVELPRRKKYDYEGEGDDPRDDWSHGFNQCLGLVRETLKAQGIEVKD